MQLQRMHLQGQIRELKRDLTDITKQHLASEWPAFMVERIALILAYEYFDGRGPDGLGSIAAARALFSLFHTHEYFQGILGAFTWLDRDGERVPLVEDVFEDAAIVHAWQPVTIRLLAATGALIVANGHGPISELPPAMRQDVRAAAEELRQIMHDSVDH